MWVGNFNTLFSVRERVRENSHQNVKGLNVSTTTHDLIDKTLHLDNCRTHIFIINNGNVPKYYIQYHTLQIKYRTTKRILGMVIDSIKLYFLKKERHGNLNNVYFKYREKARYNKETIWLNETSQGSSFYFEC